MIEGPIQVNDTGLVFYFDAKEPKSYVGKPTTNYLTTALTPNSATKESFVGSVTENSIIAPDGTLTAHKFQVTSGYVYQTLTIPVGTTITYSVWIKTLDVASTTSYGPYIWNYNSPTYGIVARDLSGVSFGWKRMSMTYTTLSHQSSFAISYAATNGGMQGLYALWRPQLEYNSSATPFVNGTRSNTQGLLDLTGSCTVDLTNTIYNADSTITFNGTSDITINDNAILKLSGDKSFCMWINMASDSSGCGFGGKSNGTVNGMSLGYGWNGNGFMALCWNSSNAPYLAKDAARDIGKWVYLAAVQEGSTRYIYALDSLGTRTSSSSGGTHSWNNNLALKIGRINDHTAMPSGSKIDLAMVYNRAISASEILKNFNSQRSRYSV